MELLPITMLIFFLGWGENARKIAGSLSTYGKIYLLLKKVAVRGDTSTVTVFRA